jgi:hypothetical protein
MSGGIIQLLTTGIQDSALINNPEITFFKKVYKQYTQFSLCQNIRFLGNLDFNKEGVKIIEKNGDLLYNQYFKIEIPYFEINKINNIISNINYGYNLNILKIIYSNLDCIIIFYNDILHIIPINLFKSFNYNIINEPINDDEFFANFLPEYIQKTPNQIIYFTNIQYDNLNSMTTTLLLISNYWEQLFTNFIIDNNIFNQLLTLSTYYNNLYLSIKKYAFNYYQQIYFLKKNNKFLNYYGEINRYFEYINNTFNINQNDYDIDITYKYCL